MTPEAIVLFAQNAGRFNRGLSSLQWGLSGVGMSVILIGAAYCFSKPTDPRQQPPPAVRWTVLVLSALIGLGIMAYAWFGFAPA